MLTKNEITALNLSPTKKDFVQIWNELLEVAGKLSERWDPTSTNESDPGIVILKALTGIADKLNYNIDKNTLEAFMPTAAQEDSMRKLCDMLGYNIKYYRSAETNVTIKYYNPDPSEAEQQAMSGAGQLIPKFTVITNADKDVSYFTTNQEALYISELSPRLDGLPCMEGQIVKCESTADNNVITASQISENNRFYMPESQIAENGIFVYNVAVEYSMGNYASKDGERWEKVDNLNIQARGLRVFKFGYDSYEGRPYLEFPEDYSELIKDGLFIYYARTSGVNGNVSARTLSQLELPGGGQWSKVSAESFSVENPFSATSGANIETINQAYNNFKKTIGTFETLVTCRDYMNKIYGLMNPATGKPYVSNSLVTDIRSDLNRAIPICSCDEAGIFYKDTPLSIVKTLVIETKESEYETNPTSEVIKVASEANKPVYQNLARYVPMGDWRKGNYITRFAHWTLNGGLPLFNDDYSEDIVDLESYPTFNVRDYGEAIAYKADGEPSDYWLIKQGEEFYTTKLKIDWIETSKTEIKTVTKTNTITKQEIKEDAIDHFDLILYPFKSYNQIRGNVKDIQEVYDASFRYDHDDNNFAFITDDLDDTKTIAHKIKKPNQQDIISINNYLRLNAIIGTHSKITSEEGTLLIENIKIALANAFNMRELDFGEEIPFDSIVAVIENADPRIKVVSLAEPALYTTFSVLDTDINNNTVIHEYAVASDWLTDSDADKSGRFEYTYKNNENQSVYIHTFNTPEAKKIYNKLAVRNILAGRVPLFKYNNTFKPSFSEGPYRVTEELDSRPLNIGLVIPSADKPFNIWVDGTTVYTSQFVNNEPKYTKTYTPLEYASNVITKDNDNNIIQIETNCEISADRNEAGQSTCTISDVTLGPGEVVKFRAPNFITRKTYPAYVNYHLKLNTTLAENAIGAKAYTLAELLNTQLEDRGRSSDERRLKALEYFEKFSLKETFTLTQAVSKKVEDQDLEYDNAFITKIENPSMSTIEKKPEDILANSSFVKLVSKKAELNWANGSTNGKPDVFISDLAFEAEDDYVFITDSEVFTNIKNFVDNELERLNNQIPNRLPTEDDWTITYTFEYVPFNNTTLAKWESFIKSNGRALFGFKPVEESGAILWRTFGGNYSKAKYVLPNTSKLIAFVSGNAETQEQTSIASTYIAEDLGRNAKPISISNNEEYMLQEQECLYIEYTPSTTTDDAAQVKESVTEIFTAGTIIKPSGFNTELGLVASEVYPNNGGSSHKTVKFDTEEIPVFSLGASEQIEIRDESVVKLDKNTLSGTTAIYYYKNFNTDKLEIANAHESYTLKDGEYIFYTDQNKSEFAYFTSGTAVELTGGASLEKCEKIDLATIFDNGIQEIPWKPLNIANGQGITFREYQYITLGEGDTLNSLFLAEYTDSLDKEWQKCDNVEYTPSGSVDTSSLPKISVSDSNGSKSSWEACSTLELRVSPNSSQTLRTTDKVKTSLKLHKENGGGEGDITIVAEKNYPLSFKTNLSCQDTNNFLAISDIYTNPNKLKSFELKVFAQETPALIQTKKNSLIPYYQPDSNTNTYLDILKWPTAQELSINEFSNLWKPIAFSSFTSTTAADCDIALKLPVNILPNTYGIFSIYISYGTLGSSDDGYNRTWIELLPGASKNDIELFNTEETSWEDNQLVLKAGLNCIRVNNTTNIFIKTGAKKGTLYFDNIRLVDSKPIEYMEGNQKKSQMTYGLNLDQFGYLDTSDEATFNVFDMHIRKKLKTELTEKALSDIEARFNEESAKFTSAEAALKASNTKLQTLENFINTTKQELNELLNSGIETEGLIAKYAEVYKDLEQEQALNVALNQNQNIEDLEQQLAIMLESFASADESSQELFEALDTLEKSTIENAIIFDKNKMSKGDILDDFEGVIKTLNIPLINDLKLASIKEINTAYTLQLEALLATIEEVEDSEKQDRLVSILDAVNAHRHEALITHINTLITNNQTNINDAINLVCNLAAGTDEDGDGTPIVDYSTLASELINLRELLSSADVKDLLSQLEFVSNSSMVNSDKYTQLNTLIEELNTLLDSNTPITAENYLSLIETVNTALTAVQTKLTSNDNAFDPKILAYLTGLSSEASNLYTERLKKLLEGIKGLLDGLNDYYNSIIGELKTSDEEVIQAVANNLTGYITARTNQLNEVNAISADSTVTNIYSSLPYAALSILAVWPAYMKQAFIAGVNKLYVDIREAINNPKIATDFNNLLDDGFYYNKEEKILRRVLVTAANLEAFQELFEKARNQVSKNIQNSKRSSLINDLGALLQPSSAMSTAMENLQVDDTADRNAILCQIITKLQSSPAVIEKQQLVKALKDELAAVIKLDTQLVEICANLLCPNLLLFEDRFRGDLNDAFYARLKDFVGTNRNNFITATTSLETLETLRGGLADTYEQLATLSLTIYTDKLVESDLFKKDDLRESLESMLLPDDYIDNLETIKNTLGLQNVIAKIKDSKLFNYLNRDLVVAWEDASGNCVDSAGNYFKKFNTAEGKWYSYTDSDLTPDNSAWYDNNGYWCTSTDELVKVELIHSKDANVWKDTTESAIEVRVSDTDTWYEVDGKTFDVSDTKLAIILDKLFEETAALSNNTISTSLKNDYRIWLLEDQLLREIRAIDKNRDFYYNVPVESNVAIDFNEGDTKANTLMNPAVNYDINNVNNNFVISKIDINYLTNGIQIARSSKLS